ncbi:MAG: hypothetical protein PWQ10_580 [Patescibacteria group bacterium]|nr:hypothetical protein [Patescibacteria group bacterium]
MEFLKIVKHRSFLNEVIYVALNIGLAIMLLVLVKVTNSILPAFVLVLLSKWRVLAVRWRFWAANIQANLVSIIVDFGFIIFLYNSNLTGADNLQNFIFQIILVILYACWLLLLRPSSKRKYIAAQAAVALFVGITSIYIISYNWPAFLVVSSVWVVGYATARHVLSSYDEDHVILLSLAWGLFLAEIGWLVYHWTIAYRLPIVTNLLLPQASIIISCLGFLVYKTYDSYFHHSKVRLGDIILPLLFTVSIIGVLVLAFNSISSGI